MLPMALEQTALSLPLLLRVALLAVSAAPGLLFAGDTNTNRAVGPLGSFSEPAVLTATIYAKTAEAKDILFKFRRTASVSNDTVRVLREFTRPDGTLAARERVVYVAGKLVSCHLEEPALGAHGGATIQPNPKNPREQIISFEYVLPKGGGTKKGSETLQNDTLNNDMIGNFIAVHWADLLRGAAVKFRFTALAKVETIGFTLTKESETIWRGKPAVIIKMEATSWIVAQFVDPLRFTADKTGAHRVLQYWGRTTPSVQKGGKWDDLDALTVFDWN